MKKIIIAIFVAAVFYTVFFIGSYPKAFYYIDTAYTQVEKGISFVKDQVAAVLLHKPVTVADLQDKYNTPVKKVRVLIVPGHEPDYGGTDFQGLLERDLNVDLAVQLGSFLKNNGKYDVLMTRDKNRWSPVFEEYFQNHWNEIVEFFRDNKEDFLKLIKTGQKDTPVARVQHNKARQDVALRLYGINKWANENVIDIVIHIHFNDYPRKNTSIAGEYSGFALYVPEKQYSNSPTTKAIADTVFKRLAKYNATSNLRMERDGIIEEPDLIAIGAYNTTNAASMLVEYGYIYEPQFIKSEIRASAIKDLAFQTYLGLQDFFGSGNDVSFAYDTLVLPRAWENEITNANPNEVFALQTALLVDGVYPSEGRTKNDCPRTGRIGPCTLGAIQEFQKKYGVKGEEGRVGNMTKQILKEKFSIKAI